MKETLLEETPSGSIETLYFEETLTRNSFLKKLLSSRNSIFEETSMLTFNETRSSKTLYLRMITLPSRRNVYLRTNCYLPKNTQGGVVRRISISSKKSMLRLISIFEETLSSKKLIFTTGRNSNFEETVCFEDSIYRSATYL